MARLWRICFLLSWFLVVTWAQKARKLPVHKTTTPKTPVEPCGASFFGPTGSLSSPNYPNSSYEHNLDCSYLIQVAGGYRIQLTFTHFETEKDRDYVTVHDGPTWEDISLLRLSGSGLPADTPLIINSTGSSLLIRFITKEGSSSKSGWAASYTIHPSQMCFAPGENKSSQPHEFDKNHYSPHRMLMDSSGTFSSPDLAGYTNTSTIRAGWIICQPDASRIVLNFDSYLVDPGNFTVKVYGGFSTSSTLLGQFGGSFGHPTDVNNLVSESGSMLIIYESQSYFYGDPLGSLPSFTATYFSCNKLDSATTCHTPAVSGSIHSPGYPNGYSIGDLLVTWLLSAPNPNYRFLLKFLDFHTGSYSGDKMTVYDGPHASHRILSSSSGTTGLSKAILTSGSKCLVRFKTSGDVGLRGPWKGNYVSLTAAEASAEEAAMQTTTSTSTTTKPPTPSKPAALKPRMIGGSQSSKPADMSTSTSSTPHQPASPSSTSAFSIKGEDRAVDVPHVDPLDLSLNLPQKPAGSNDTNSVHVTTSCGGSLSGENGTFHSPNFPEDYDNRLHCFWNITAPSDAQQILLSFTDFDTESCCDLVTVYDGPTNTSVILLQASGSGVPSPVMTTGPHCLVKFRTDYVESSSGWKAVFTAVRSEALMGEGRAIVQSSSVSPSPSPSTLKSTIKSTTPKRNASPSFIPSISTAALTIAFMLAITGQMVSY